MLFFPYFKLCIQVLISSCHVPRFFCNVCPHGLQLLSPRITCLCVHLTRCFSFAFMFATRVIVFRARLLTSVELAILFFFKNSTGVRGHHESVVSLTFSLIAAVVWRQPDRLRFGLAPSHRPLFFSLPFLLWAREVFLLLNFPLLM